MGTKDPNYYYDTARVHIVRLRNTLCLSLFLYPNERLLISLLGQLPFSQSMRSLYGYAENLFK